MIESLVRTNKRSIEGLFAPKNMKKLLVFLFPILTILVGDTSTHAVTASSTSPIIPSQLGNISTRAFVQQAGANVMIGGFIIKGTEPKTVIVRAIGPELTQYGVPNVLADPRLDLHDGTGAVIGSNDNWQSTIIGGIITADQFNAIQGSGYAPTAASESAIIATLQPGNYTAVVYGSNNTTGVALVEVYDLSPGSASLLTNISTRSFVQEPGANVMIGGFIVRGSTPKTVIIRAIGPELTQYGVPNVLVDPILDLHDGAGNLIASNDNWQHSIIGGIITSDQVNDIRYSSGLAPTDGREPAIIATLAPGNYTAIVRGNNNTTGVALVEVYDLNPIFSTASGIVSPGGGTISLQGIGDIVFRSGTFVADSPVETEASDSFDIESDFNDTAAIFSAGPRLPYQLRINTGNVAPSVPVDVLFSIPDAFITSLPNGSGFGGFVQLLTYGDSESQDEFDLCPSVFDSASRTLRVTVPPEAFTNERRTDGKFEAIVMVSSIVARTYLVDSASVMKRVAGGNLGGPNSSATELCELNPIGSPLTNYFVTEAFNPPGCRPAPTPCPAGRVHQGIDLRATTGDPVFAVSDGTVKYKSVQTCKKPKDAPANWNGCERIVNGTSIHRSEGQPWGWGEYLVIEHDDHSLSLYAHLDLGSTSGLHIGDRVTRGNQIARADNSGTSTGSHLHFEYILPLFPNEQIPPDKFTLRTNPAACITPNATPTPTPTPSAPLNGTWVGTWQWSGPGSNGCQFNDGGSFSMNLTQTGSSFSGSTSADGIQTRDDATCELISTDSGTGTASGTVSGASVNISFTLTDIQTLYFNGTATLNGNTLTASFVRSTGGSGSFSVTRN